MLTNEEKFKLALSARERAYVPYSKFKVGALVIFDDDSYVMGCNIENASYGLTVCAERNAIFSSITSGKDPFKIKELVCIADTPNPTSPCGACRQVMSEFMSKDAIITLFNIKGDCKVFKLEELLPYSFSDEDLVK